jgi:hypothetical protein
MAATKMNVTVDVTAIISGNTCSSPGPRVLSWMKRCQMALTPMLAAQAIGVAISHVKKIRR